MPLLGVNIDHIATLRQARREEEPDPVLAAQIAEKAGADSIVAHLREDRRHIHDQDVKRLRRTIKKKFNLEMSLQKDIVRIACQVKPDQATLVPERREEITTEGGLDVLKHFKRIKDVSAQLQAHQIEVSLFIDPVKKQLEQTKEAGVNVVELHTGRYDRASTVEKQKFYLQKIDDITQYAISIGLVVNAGHGLKYYNTYPIARIKGMNELNIGHSIISQAVFVGLSGAVKDMRDIVHLKKRFSR
ncbi:MAG: pyridoxine 5'-phosphate synthase [Candidatus Omnitrophica bacterium]|nr:pyridoxine 5'-phosphate synthase [Candidatus Omnitrophota bacterium]